MFQSTRPHGARQYFSRKRDVRLRVSIHAPARGATGGMSRIGHGALVSIHAPARGATSRYTICPKIPTMFQSTRPHGARRRNEEDGDNESTVSIHAPARGAT